MINWYLQISENKAGAIMNPAPAHSKTTSTQRPRRSPVRIAISTLLWAVTACVVVIMAARFAPSALSNGRLIPEAAAFIPWLALLSVLVLIIAALTRRESTFRRHRSLPCLPDRVACRLLLARAPHRRGGGRSRPGADHPARHRHARDDAQHEERKRRCRADRLDRPRPARGSTRHARGQRAR